MKKTENFALNQWDPHDPIRREDFNADNAAIDGALAAVGQTVAALAANLGTGGANARLAWGSYEGDNTCGASYPNTLTFDFKPALVYLLGFSTGNSLYQGLLLRPSPWGSGPNGMLTTTWADRSVSWYFTNLGYGGDDCIGQLNKLSYTYYYVAIGVEG